MVQYNRKGFGFLFLVIMALVMIAACAAHAAPQKTADKSDLNQDSVVDILDLQLFSANYLETDVALVDWCLFYESTINGDKFEGNSTNYYAKNFKMLLAFINDEFNCDGNEPPPPPPVTAEPRYLVRGAQADDGTGMYYFTDAKTHSVFIYDAQLNIHSELTGMLNPLGVAIDSRGYLLVGNDGRDNVEVFDPDTGLMVAMFGTGLVKMPTAITVGPDGFIYVTDSQNHRVCVFDTDYALLRTIGSGGQGTGELDFPTDTEVVTYLEGAEVVQEILVADQGNNRIQIYDHDGNYLRTIKSGCGSFSCKPPELKRVQALAVDSQGRLHVLDNFKAVVNVLNPETGAVMGSYGEYGEEAGFLRVPLDLLINDVDEAVINAGDGARIEIMAIP